MKIDGGCHCGRISWKAEIDPANVVICHCTDCQSLSGTAFRTVGQVSAESFEISGEPKTYVKTADSGAKRAQTFCPECGSPVYSATADETPSVYMLRLGTCRQRSQLIPQGQKWLRSAMPWLADIPSISELDRK